MNTDFSKLDKTDFKCLETDDGAVYYGQVVQIVPPTVEVASDKMAGFHPRATSADESLRKSQTTELSANIGEVQEPLIVADIEKVDEELKEQVVTVRHGNGIQIQADKVTKYAGQWRFGARHGDGHLVSSDGSEYRGNLNYGKFDGYGQYSWPKQESATVSEKFVGHCYVGQWKLGLMHGCGEFQHSEGQVYKPDFCNSLFHLADGLFINPFDTQAEVNALTERIKQRKTKEDAEAQKQSEHCSVKRVVGVGQYRSALNQIRESGRTPLVISTLQFPVETADLIAHVGIDQQIVNNAFLRTLGKLCGSVKGNANLFIHDLRCQYRKDYYSALQEGHAWVFNILLDEEEDEENPWNHVYDPDINMFFGKYGLPQQCWKGKAIFDNIDTCPDQIRDHLDSYFEQEYQRIQEEAMAQQAETEVRSRRSGMMSADGQSFREVEVDREAIMCSQLDVLRQELLIQMTIFSRFKIDETLEDEELLAQLKDKFCFSVPLKHVDIVLVQSWDEAEDQQDGMAMSATADELEASASALRTTEMEGKNSKLK